ncbi:MAG: squalene/phytoene synthase family protein [Pirellulaceae bacterium]
MNPELADSYRHCRLVARRAASNFAWAFRLLPAEQRRSMEALYAFARQSDDLADGPEPASEKQRRLSAWREQLNEALAGRPPGRILPALTDTVARHQIPGDYLRQIVTGVEMDLDHQGYETFAELRHYCERVASAVGLACLSIWDCKDERANAPATDCGIAFQLTNILRDLCEDARLGRCYLPREDLARLECNANEILAGQNQEAWQRQVLFQCARARQLYASAAATEKYLRGSGRRMFRLMHATYFALLAKIEREPAAVLTRRLRVSRPQKVWIAVRTLVT